MNIEKKSEEMLKHQTDRNETQNFTEEQPIGARTLTDENQSTSSYKKSPEIPTKLSIESRLTKQLSASATQTPLILTRVGIIKSNPENIPSINSDVTLPYVETDKEELPFAFQTVHNKNNKLSLHPSNVDHQIPGCSKSYSMQSVKEIPRKCSRTIATQATPPYTATLSSSSAATPKESFQIPTSLASRGSIPRSELLSITTDYNGLSPDAHSLIVDLVDQIGHSSIPNADFQLSIQEAFGLPPTSDLSQRSTSSTGNNSHNRRRRYLLRKFRKFLRCGSSVEEESPERFDVRPHLRDAPPTYSAVFAAPTLIPYSATRNSRCDDRRLPFLTMNHSSFIAPTPPPSYAQSQGFHLGSYALEQANTVLWSPRPTAAVCPRCMALVFTTTETRRTAVTHFGAFLLCLCGCWPCCMLPYCMDSCKSTDHYCPVCHTYLGTYTPW